MEPENREPALSQLLFDTALDANFPQMALTEILLEHVHVVAQPLAFPLLVGWRIVGDKINRRSVGRPDRRRRAVDAGCMARQLFRRAALRGEHPKLRSEERRVGKE